MTGEEEAEVSRWRRSAWEKEEKAGWALRASVRAQEATAILWPTLLLPPKPTGPSLSLSSSPLIPSFSSTYTIMSSHSGSAANNIVGVHYRVGKKIGEGSFGVIFEGNFP